MAAKDPVEKISNAFLLNSVDSTNVGDNGNQISGVLFRYNIVITLSSVKKNILIVPSSFDVEHRRQYPNRRRKNDN